MNGNGWRTAAACNPNGSCVEFAMLPGSMIGLRDSKLGEASPVLAFTADEWLTFLDGCSRGEFTPAGRSQAEEMALHSHRFPEK